LPEAFALGHAASQTVAKLLLVLGVS